MADIARMAIDDAVSNPRLVLSYGYLVDIVPLYQNQTAVPPDTSRPRGINLLSDQVERTLAFQGRSTKVITEPIILMSKVFP